jgi:hypothetical protein
MHTVWLIIAIQATVLGFAFLLAGFMNLVAPSEGEIEASRGACEAARQKGRWHGFFYSLTEVGRYRFRGLSLFIAHWPERPQSRKLIYVGVAFLVVAAAVGYSLGAFAS